MCVCVCVCMLMCTSLQFIVWIWLKRSQSLQVWGPALGQLDPRLLLVWFPSGGHRLKIWEELRFRFESRGRKRGCPGSKAVRQEEFPLVCGKVRVVLFGSSADWMRPLHWRGQPPFLRPLFQRPVSPKTPNALTDKSRIMCDQVTGHSITLTYRINITMCVCVPVCLFKIPSTQILFTKCNSPLKGFLEAVTESKAGQAIPDHLALSLTSTQE